jgi:CRISPR-associated protein Csa1
MFYVSRYELDRMVRKFRAGGAEVSDELRGWNWDNEYLAPISDDIYLGVSEIANRYCPVYRDIYMKRVLFVEAPISYKTVRGWVYHSISSETLTLVKSYLYSHGIVPGYILYRDLVKGERGLVSRIFRFYKVKGYLDARNYKRLYRDSKSLYRYLVLQASAYTDRVISTRRNLTKDDLVNEVVPSVVERVVDGSALGLSSELRIDMFLDSNIVLDIKTGDYRDFHKYALAGYALAIESNIERPVDFGIVCYVRVINSLVKIRTDFYFLDDELRREFINIRDNAMEIIHLGRDPGKPDRCPRYCIYYKVCLEK